MSGWLVVNADDFGVSRGTTLGTLRAHRDGVVSSASLATTTPWYRFALEQRAALAPELAVGLHFTLTSGRPSAPRDEVPLLVDAEGRFRWRFTSLLAATSSARGGELRAQVARELEAQLQRLREDGIVPDHVNGERHVHLIPAIFALVTDAARRHGIGFVRAGREAARNLLRASDLPRTLAGGALKSVLLGTLSARARRSLDRPVRTPDHVASYLYTGRADQVLERLLRRAPLPGITEVMVHPALPVDDGDDDLGNAELRRYLRSSDRLAELQACLRARGQLGAWKLTTYGRLAQERA